MEMGRILSLDLLLPPPPPPEPEPQVIVVCTAATAAVIVVDFNVPAAAAVTVKLSALSVWPFGRQQVVSFAANDRVSLSSLSSLMDTAGIYIFMAELMMVFLPHSESDDCMDIETMVLVGYHGKRGSVRRRRRRCRR
jgi:hypothetical protein